VHGEQRQHVSFLDVNSASSFRIEIWPGRKKLAPSTPSLLLLFIYREFHVKIMKTPCKAPDQSRS